MECCWCSRCAVITNYWADLLRFDRFGEIAALRPYNKVNSLVFAKSNTIVEIIFILFYLFGVFVALSSFYGRIENSIGCLPRFYYHNKPHIAFTESGRRNTHHEAPKVSFNWIINRFNVEKIESKTGKLIPPKSGISRLSKRSLLRNFETIKQRMAHINTGRRLTYADEKALATDFQVWILLFHQMLWYFCYRFINISYTLIFT